MSTLVESMYATAAKLEVSCLGVSICVECRADDIDIGTLIDYLPPGSAVSAADATQPQRAAEESGLRRAGTFQLDSHGIGYRLTLDGSLVCQTDCRDEFLHLFESATKLYIADRARDRVVVHAGVVSWNDRAILFPGSSYAGKSTLVSELLRHGAGYLSDDFAILDHDGYVHPYNRPLVLRDPCGRRHRMSPRAFGAKTIKRHLPIGMIVFTQFEPGYQWQPTEVSCGEATLKLLEHTVSARRDPKTAIQVLGRIASHATSLSGLRGNASQVARNLV